MKSKKLLLVTFSGIIVIVTAIMAVIHMSGMLASAEYSSEYNKTFGEFTANTASELLKNKKENTCYSPVSLFGALSMFAELTEGDTREDALEVLGFDSVEELEKNYEQMLGDIDVDTDESKITLANSFWLRGKEISEETGNVVNNIQEKLDCEFFLRDEIKKEEVNSWVNGKTNGLIPKILNADDKQMAFINTLYYKSSWDVDIVETEEEVFYLENGHKEKVTYLSADREKMNYKVEDDYTYVEVPLDSGEAILVLPDEDEDLQDLLEEDVLNEILASVTKTTEKNWGLVNIRFPKFDISYDVGTEQIYKALKANGASEDWNHPDWIGDIVAEELEMIQKTELVVNKDGIEAAAATGMYYETVGIGDIIEVDLDITYERPFMFILMKDGVPLFIGTVYNP